MNAQYVRNRYFEWLCGMILDYGRTEYTKLLTYLHSKEFRYSIVMDGNREADGIDLRYRFGDELQLHPALIATQLDTTPCSMLEMMVALANRCEESIMNEPDSESGPEKWFWIMIDNMGLSQMSNAAFDIQYTDNVIEKFLNRQYDRNGDGGLFIIDNCSHDIRNVEIWTQMCWYLDEYLNM